MILGTETNVTPHWTTSQFISFRISADEFSSNFSKNKQNQLGVLSKNIYFPQKYMRQFQNHSVYENRTLPDLIKNNLNLLKMSKIDVLNK